VTEEPPSASALGHRFAGRRLLYSSALLLLLSLVVWGGWQLSVADEEEDVVHFTQVWEHAQSMAVLPGPRQGGMEPRVPPPLPSDTQAWLPTTLPAHTLGGVDPDGPIDNLVLPVTLWWYRLRYVVPPGMEGPLAIYIPRVVGAAVQVVSLESGRWLVRWDGTEQRQDQWNRPVLVQLGDAGPQGRVVDVAIRLTRQTNGPHSLTDISIGPLLTLEHRAQARILLQLVAPQVSSLTFASLGLVALLYWLGRRRDHSYLLFTLTAVAWTLRNLHYYVSTPLSEPAKAWFWWVSNASLSWVVVLIYLFAMRFHSRRFARVEWLLVGFVSIVSVLTVPPLWAASVNVLGLHLLNTVVALVSLMWLSWAAWREGGHELRIVTFALWVTALAGFHDVLLAQGVVPLESVYLLPLATMVIFLAFLQAAQLRYSHAIWHVEHANAMLEHRLAEREAQLRTNHERLRGVEREQALLLERQRLMRDMHDGLGSTLMSTLVLVEQGKLEGQAVAELLRECVDDLRLVIDSLEPIDHDLVTLLAALRHRLGRRLESAGLLLHWDVEDLPPLPWLHPPDALQILRLVQEVLTNILKHARAQQVFISLSLHGPQVWVRIRDDGVGFEPHLVTWGRGLRHLAQRAERLGGQVEVLSHLGQGTEVRLSLPLERSS
jgi:signal transduction histidine kinase